MKNRPVSSLIRYALGSLAVGAALTACSEQSPGGTVVDAATAPADLATAPTPDQAQLTMSFFITSDTGTGDLGIVVGTAMAGLNGAVYSQTLTKTGIGFNFPAERLFHMNGTPRHLWLPPVRVDLRGQDDEGRDAILERALMLLRAPPK